MLAKKTSKHQVTLPKAIVQQIPDTEYFDVSVQKGAVLLKPVVVSVCGRASSRSTGEGPGVRAHGR